MVEAEIKVVGSDESSLDQGDKPKQQRDRSSIAFPYSDLDDAQSVVDAIHDNGGSQGDLASLASWMKHEAVTSGTFRNKVAAARIFGAVEVAKGIVTLTPLGHEMADPKTKALARAKAFLNVPLYNEIFQMYEGRQLPSNIGIEREFENLGVATKQTDKARQVMMRSATQAGFTAQGEDRLVRPNVMFRSPGSPSDSKNDGETPPPPPPPPPSGESKTIALRGGGTLTLSASVKFFDLPKAERDFVFKLIDELAEYEEETAIKHSHAPEDSDEAVGPLGAALMDALRDLDDEPNSGQQ